MVIWAEGKCDVAAPLAHSLITKWAHGEELGRRTNATLQ